jgi:hypothetical protein
MNLELSRQNLVIVAPTTILVWIFLCFMPNYGCKQKKIEKKADVVVASTDDLGPVLEFELGTCRGTCPAYHASFYEGGKMIYEGINNVKHIGKYQFKVNEQTVNELIATVQQTNPFTLKDSYGIAPDFPSTVLTIKIKGKTKRIETTADVPPALAEIYPIIKQTIEQITNASEGQKLE